MTITLDPRHRSHAGPLTLQRLREIAGSVTDPEIPVLTLHDLGILRDVQITADGTVEVTLTPTYTGCPATAVIAADVETACAQRVSTGWWSGPCCRRPGRPTG